MRWNPYPKIATQDPLTYQRVSASSPEEPGLQGHQVGLAAMAICLPVCCQLSPFFRMAFPAVTTLRQRLLQPDFQPSGASQLHPKHKHLLMKRSLRCRVRLCLFVFFLIIVPRGSAAVESRTDIRLSFPRNASII